MTMEERYWELRENCERALDKCWSEPTDENRLAYREALSQYQDACMDILEKLMDENADVLKNLKEW